MKLLGIVDNVNECCCCGKTGLVRTVALDNGGEVVYYGTTCASVALGYGREYTSRNAHKLIERVKNVEYYRGLLNSAIANAQRIANETSEPQLVLYKTSTHQKRGWYSVMQREQYFALNSISSGSIRAEINPEAV